MANPILDRFDAMFRSFGTIDRAAQTGSRVIYSLRCKLTGESQQVLVCSTCAKEMPLVDGENVTVDLADDDCRCDICGAQRLGAAPRRSRSKP